MGFGEGPGRDHLTPAGSDAAAAFAACRRAIFPDATRQVTRTEPDVHGKPFGAVFDPARARLPGVSHCRIGKVAPKTLCFQSVDGAIGQFRHI